MVVDGEQVQAKNCTRCGQIKPLTEFYSHKDGVGGRRPTCKQCICSEGKKYREYKGEEFKQKMSEYRERNREKIRNYHRQWSAENREKIREWNRTHYKKKKPAYRVKWQRREAVKRRLPAEINTRVMERILDQFNGCCALTGKDGEIHLDHFIALSTGHGGTYEGNLIPLIKEMNLSKNSQNPFEWVKTREDIDPEMFERVVAYLAHLNGLSPEEYKDFVYWCYENKRDIAQIDHNESSLSLWKRNRCVS